MAETVRETIKNIIRNHLKKRKGKVFGQCLTAVGWVGGTLPELYEKDGMIELSMADVAGADLSGGTGDRYGVVAGGDSDGGDSSGWSRTTSDSCAVLDSRPD